MAIIPLAGLVARGKGSRLKWAYNDPEAHLEHSEECNSQVRLHTDRGIELAVEEELGKGMRTKILRPDPGPFPSATLPRDTTLNVLPVKTEGVHCGYWPMKHLF